MLTVDSMPGAAVPGDAQRCPGVPGALDVVNGHQSAKQLVECRSFSFSFSAAIGNCLVISLLPRPEFV